LPACRSEQSTALSLINAISGDATSWSAVAERSGDTAFARARAKRTDERIRPHESGVALRFPPQSRIVARGVRAATSCRRVVVGEATVDKPAAGAMIPPSQVSGLAAPWRRRV